MFNFDFSVFPEQPEKRYKPKHPINRRVLFQILCHWNRSLFVICFDKHADVLDLVTLMFLVCFPIWLMTSSLNLSNQDVYSISEWRIRTHEHPPALDWLDDREAGVALRVSDLLLHLVPRDPGHQGRLLLPDVTWVVFASNVLIIPIPWPICYDQRNCI